jgi:very-short-patch-repair endonuclease
VRREPDRPWVAVPRNRNVSAEARDEVHVVHSDARGVVTDPTRTVIDCARRLPFGEALTVADAALRHGVDATGLVDAAAVVRGKGAAQARRVVTEATPLAANALESMLRAIAIDVGLAVRPQVPIELPGRTVRPDLVDEGRLLVVEAEGFTYHGGSIQFSRDVWRYTTLVARGWTVLRFTHRHVMTQADWVAEILSTYLPTGRQLPRA